MYVYTVIKTGIVTVHLPLDSVKFCVLLKGLYEQHGALTWKLFIKFARNVFDSPENNLSFSRPSTFYTIDPRHFTLDPRHSTLDPRQKPTLVSTSVEGRGSRVKCWGSRVECGGSIVKLKQKKTIKHSLIKTRSNSPMSHDIFCMILDLWRRMAGELIS